jgi:hypothetical protein
LHFCSSWQEVKSKMTKKIWNNFILKNVILFFVNVLLF